MSDNEDLNFASENFDPIKALYSQNVEPPNPRVPVLDNLSKFELTPEGELITKKITTGTTKEKVAELEEKEEKQTGSKVDESKSSQPSTSSTTDEKKEEEEEEEQAEGSQKGKMTFVKRKKAKNVLTRMEDMKGPLSKLRFCMEQRQRVKICTRTGHGVRGTLEGFVEAFDKQWNLALRDVHEVWTSTKTNKAKAPPIVGGKVLSTSDAAFRREMFGIKVPRVAVVNSTKKRVTLERHIDQLLVRGEQIVFIIV